MHNLQTVGNNGGSIFEHLLTKVHEVLKQCSAPLAVSSYVYMFHSEDTRYYVQKLSKTSEKQPVLGHPNF